MKNLTISRHSRRKLDTLKNEIARNLQYSRISCTINPNNDDLYIALQNQLYIIPSDQEHEIISVNINNKENNKIIGLEYTNITQQVYCAYENGDLMTINIDSELDHELVTQISGGLSCITLSPDHEVITLVTANDTVITMVSSFDIISEVDLQALSFGEKQFITVGWGKKETQFHGSIGKSAAIVKSIEVHKNDSDDGQPRITWRGDGSLFAVSFIQKDSDIRQFKVFNREGILQYTSELTNNMEESLSWKPSGNFIATTQKLINKHVVSLFEKNGLKHREFLLSSDVGNLIVKEIFWSPDSDILTIWCEQTKYNTVVLQLWTENNCHWYLKQTFTFSNDDPLLYSTWSSSITCRKTLILLTMSNVLTYSFHWAINHSQGQSVEDNGVVAVIDGKKALLTGFKLSIIPPPMSHQSLECPESINGIVFAPNVKNTESGIDTNDFFCVLENNRLAFFKYMHDRDNLEYKYMGTYEIELDVTVLTVPTHVIMPYMQHFLWFKENIILSSISMNNQSILCVMTLNFGEGRVTVQQTHIMDGLIEHIIYSPNMEEAYVIVEGSVLKYKDNEFDFIGTKLPQFSHKVNVVQIGRRHVILSLSYGNRLSIDSKEIANNITSFYLHPKFLLLTTAQHTLICVTLDEEGLERLSKQNLTIKPWEDNLSEQSIKDLNVRRIERGSFLIIALPNDSKTILQMPRGNLECIQPRALSLYIIGEHLKKREYLAAFDLMRKQRINLNLIYDYEPQLFLQNANKFVEDIANPQWLSLFLSELQNEDVTSTIYSDCYLNNKKQTTSENENKIALVCDLLRNILEERQDADNFIQPILISLVKNREKQGLEGALRKLKEIKALESKEIAQSISSEDALKYLLYLVDVNVLFDTALGMYDFELTMFIASKSQKDPKEYVPFLNDLKNLDENFMKYSIDMHLKRYESALNHISKDAERFNECLNLIQKQNLYIKGLKLFKKDTKEYKEIAQIYAKHLLNKSKYKEAAIMFHKANDYNNALYAYKMAGCWQETIIVSALLNLSPVELHALYKELQTRLCEDKRYFEAAQILICYLNNPEKAVAILCEGKFWKDAIRIATDVHRSDLIETRIKSGIQEHAEHIMTQIIKNKENFEKYKTRLAALRIEMIHRQTQIHDDTLNDDVFMTNKGINDFLSDTSSTTGSITSQGSRTSTTSKRSYRSSKNRRKQERKLLSMREGSMFEDLGLIRALHEIITKTYRQKDELDLLIQMLLYFNDDEGAEKLQDCMKDFIAIIEKSKSKIWDKSAPTSFSEINSIDTSISKQNQEILLPQRLVESHIMFPPEEATSTGCLNIF